MSTLELLEALAAEPGRLEKERLLREHPRRIQLKKLLLYALDPYRRYGVRNYPKYRKSEGDLYTASANLDDMYELLDSLRLRKYAGERAWREVVSMSLRLEKDESEIFDRVLRKDLRCGVNRKIVNAVFPGLVPEFELQAARTLDPERLPPFPIWGEPKIDGMRAVAVCRAGEVEFLSRGGRPIRTMDHLASQIAGMLPRGGVLDGEAVAAGSYFEKSMSAVKRASPKEGSPVQFLVFDHLTLREWDERECQRPWVTRQTDLHAAARRGQDGLMNLLKVVTARKISGYAEALAYYEERRAAGFEGAVLKRPDGLYEFKRSAAWLKMKASETVDVEITGFVEGKGKYAGQLGALEFRHGGQTCRAGGGFSDADRRSLWRRRRGLPGLLMEVEFTEETAKGRTRHARFLRLRDHDGERD